MAERDACANYDTSVSDEEIREFSVRQGMTNIEYPKISGLNAIYNDHRHNLSRMSLK